MKAPLRNGYLPRLWHMPTRGPPLSNRHDAMVPSRVTVTVKHRLTLLDLLLNIVAGDLV